MLPVIELRGAIPVAIGYGLSPTASYAISVAGNMLPIPFILLFIRPAFELLKKRGPFKRIVKRLEDRAYKKSGDITKKATGAVSLIALTVFVAIPLPGTGAWTGSLIAAILNIKFRYAIACVFIGVLIAGAVVLLVTTGAFAGAAALKGLFFIK